MAKVESGAELLSLFDRYKKAIRKERDKAIKRAIDGAAKEYRITLENELRDIFKRIVVEYYSSYSPRYYIRNRSMYNILTFKDNENGGFSVGFDPSQMTSFRNGYDGEDGLYDQVFRKGWHGGAGSSKYGDHPNEGTPYWRTPYEKYYRWGEDAAVFYPSPLERWKDKIDSKDWKSEYTNVIVKHWNKEKPDAAKILREVM